MSKNKYNYTCNKCGADLEQHKNKKKYFYCDNCKVWLECWLPLTEKQLKKAIEKITENEER